MLNFIHLIFGHSCCRKVIQTSWNIYGKQTYNKLLQEQISISISSNNWNTINAKKMLIFLNCTTTLNTLVIYKSRDRLLRGSDSQTGRVVGLLLDVLLHLSRNFSGVFQINQLFRFFFVRFCSFAAIADERWLCR